MSHRHRTVREIQSLLGAAGGARLERYLTELADDDRTGVRIACASARVRAEAARREADRTRSLYSLERTLHAEGCLVVAGIDEVGRGALAGPLTAAAVVLLALPRIEGLDDSKRLTPSRREELSERIHASARSVSIAHVSATEIDSIGMSSALRRVVELAIASLAEMPDHIVIDGLPLRIRTEETAVVKGDSKVAAIAAASIVAKVARDALMRDLALQFPEYGFDINKGYGTPEHLAAIARVGASSVHRHSFTLGGGTMSLF